MASGRDSDWREYSDRMAGRPPRQTLLAALERFGGDASGRSAVDLGCGEGRDTIALLRRGWRVLAIDAEAAAIARLVARPGPPPGAALETRCTRLQDAPRPAGEPAHARFA